ncbi:MAG: hypothetical protein JW795_04090 [Chitinivibrionales bacterium]|nr:hypothetical protein [Chitinivibrionales bacterium]
MMPEQRYSGEKWLYSLFAFLTQYLNSIMQSLKSTAVKLFGSTTLEQKVAPDADKEFSAAS